MLRFSIMRFFISQVFLQINFRFFRYVFSVVAVLFFSAQGAHAQESNESRIQRHITSQITTYSEENQEIDRSSNPLQDFLERTYAPSDNRNTQIMLNSAIVYRQHDMLDEDGETMVARRMFNDHAHEVAHHLLEDSPIKETFYKFKRSISTFREYTSLEVKEDLSASLEEDENEKRADLFKLSLRPRISGEIQAIISLPNNLQVNILPKNRQARLTFTVDF